MADELIRTATLQDVIDIVPRLRQCDIDECEALAGEGSVLRMAVATVTDSTLAMTYVRDGQVTAMFGVAGRLLDDEGCPWMFGTEDMPAKSVVREGRKFVPQWLKMFKRLSNVVDTRNKKSIRWLKSLGFKFEQAIPVGPLGVPFYPFSMGG